MNPIIARQFLPIFDANLAIVCMNPQPNNPLHGKTLEAILTELVDHYGWEQLGRKIKINCFMTNPSIKSSLAFLRKTDWARKQVEELYLQTNFY